MMEKIIISFIIWIISIFICQYIFDDTDVLVFLVSLAPAVIYFSTSHIHPRRHFFDDFMNQIVPELEKHSRTLASARKRLIKKDAYGNLLPEYWERELQNFINNHIIPKYETDLTFGPFIQEIRTDFDLYNKLFLEIDTIIYHKEKELNNQTDSKPADYSFEAQTNPDIRRCINCGNEINVVNKFCSVCGEKV